MRLRTWGTSSVEAVVVGDLGDALGQLRPCRRRPLRPRGDRRPGDGVRRWSRRRGRSGRPGGRARRPRPAARRGGSPGRPAAGRDLVDRADHRQDRARDVGEREEPVLDHEAALEHPVVGDELVQEVGHRRPRPRHPAVGLQEPALALAGQQRLAVVQPQDEVDPAAHRLDRIEQPKAGAARPRRHAPMPRTRVGEHVRRARRRALGDPERHRRRVSTGLPKVTSERAPRCGGRPRSGSRTSRPGE